MEKRTLVTGATGFVGSNVVRGLINNGWDVHIIVRRNSHINLIKHLIRSNAIYVHDGTTENMLEIMKEVKPEIVFHLASFFVVEHDSKDIENIIQSNVLFGTQLIEAMIKNKVYKLINTGTSWEHFENDDYNPVCLYAATKKAFETILKYYVESTLLKIITLKLFDTYGPDDPRPKLIPSLQKILKNKSKMLMSPGEQLLDLVYIEDVVRAYLCAAEQIQKHTLRMIDYTVSSGEPIKLKELVRLFGRINNTEIPVEWGGKGYRTREVMIPWNKGLSLPGWKPVISIEEGLKNISSKL